MTKAPVRFEASEFDEWSHTPDDSGNIAAHVNARLADYFKDAVEVTSFKEAGYFSSWRLTPKPTDTHRALLIGIEKVEKEVSKEEILRVLRWYGENWSSVNPDESVRLKGYRLSDDLADRIEKEGIKP